MGAVWSALPRGQRHELHPQRHERLARARGRAEDHVVAHHEVYERLLLVGTSSMPRGRRCRGNPVEQRSRRAKATARAPAHPRQAPTTRARAAPATRARKPRPRVPTFLAARSTMRERPPEIRDDDKVPFYPQPPPSDGREREKEHAALQDASLARDGRSRLRLVSFGVDPPAMMGAFGTRESRPCKRRTRSGTSWRKARRKPSEPVGRARHHERRDPLEAVAGGIGMGDSSAAY